jgi:hypothetical protein
VLHSQASLSVDTKDVGYQQLLMPGRFGKFDGWLVAGELVACMLPAAKSVLASLVPATSSCVTTHKPVCNT